MGQYLYIPFLVGWTSINPSYFDVNYRGTIGFDTLPYSHLIPLENPHLVADSWPVTQVVRGVSHEMKNSAHVIPISIASGLVNQHSKYE